MNFYEDVVRNLLFKLDAETAHDLGMKAISSGAISVPTFSDPRLRQELFGVSFNNPLGLAAGFDKNAVAIDAWENLGFGFVEVGTITYHAQPGNDKPRLFRLPADKAIINRFGFNNDGAAVVAERIRRANPAIPIGINLGKSKVTALEDAPADYQASYRLLHSLGDYFVVNVSSPNTPGLRALQDKSALKEIFSALAEVDDSRPMFVKVAPDLEWDAFDDVVEIAVETKLTGIIATNTTIRRDGLHDDPRETGGLSGAPLKQRANDVMRHLRANAPAELVLIGVGGIFDANDLWERIASGANLCQMYTGWIYGGPTCVPRILRDFVKRMDREGANSIEDVRSSS